MSFAFLKTLFLSLFLLLCLSTAAQAQTRVESMEFDLSGIRPFGIWSNNTTVWVAHNSFSGNDSLRAYHLTGTNRGSRDSGKDITLHSDNSVAAYIWSNGTTVWVIDLNDTYIYAYTLTGDDQGSRDDAQDINLDSANDNPRGIWSNGTTIWVADERDNKLYAYRLTGTNRGN